MIETAISSQIVYFDICALINLCVIFYSLFYRKIVVGISNITFTVLVSCVLLSTVFDIFNCLYSLKINFIWSYKNLFVRYFCICGYYLARNITLPMYAIYLVVVSGGWSVLTKKKGLMISFFVPYFILVLLIISNLFTSKVFYFDENFNYTRGKWIIFFYIDALFYVLIGFFILIKYKRIFSREKFVPLCSMIPMNLVAVIIQFINPTWLVECFCTTTSLLLVTFTVQRPEENLDFRYGSFNGSAFKEDVYKYLTLGNTLNIIVVGIKNFDVIKSILTQQDFSVFMKTFADILQDCKKTISYTGDLYYFDGGTFTFMSIKESKDRAIMLSKDLDKVLTKGTKIGKVNLNIDPAVCVVECPIDFPDYDSLASFINRYKVFFSDVKGVINFEKYSDHVNYKIKADLNDVISRGIKHHGFMVYYQPIYSTKKDKFISAEALIRLCDEKWGFVSPELFIPAAEKNGTILHIGKIVLEEVCKFISSPVFATSGLEYIEINLSVAQCLQSDLVEVISTLLEKYNVKPNQINLEITERETIFDQQIFEDNLTKLNDLGISFSLDDYGTGYSNIRRIVQLPIDIVKIDKSFVDEFSNDKMQSVITNTVRMLKEIDKEIVVEGVETKESLETFRKLDCDYIQGYYFSKPLDEKSFIEKVQQMNKK